jgi:hypothetical protein
MPVKAPLLPVAELPACGFWLPILIPGDVDSTAIRKDYDTTLQGLRAFVRMGFRLMDVKSRLPHGNYSPWCAEHLGGLSRAVLSRAKQIAHGFAKCFACETFDRLPPEAIAIIEGCSEKGGYRALLAAVHEFPTGALEQKNRLICEGRWQMDAELRDEWEPRVLSGECTYTEALNGMNGQELKGKQRPGSDYYGLLTRNLTSLPLCWPKFGELPPEQQSELLVKLPNIAQGAPPVALEVLRKAIDRELAREGRKP